VLIFCWIFVGCWRAFVGFGLILPDVGGCLLDFCRILVEVCWIWIDFYRMFVDVCWIFA